MENLTLHDLMVLAQKTAIPSISIFMPTHRAGPETQQDPLRFKNLLQDAEQRLRASGMGPRDVSALLQPAEALLNDTSFWRHLYDGLAVWIAPDDFHAYRLPFSVEEKLILARSYYIQTVLPLFTNNGHYYILAISQNEVRLFEGTRDSVGQIDLPEGTPESLDEALKFDDPEKHLQSHSVTSQGGARDSAFHGHGPGDEEQKDRIERYLNLVDAGLKEIFREQHAPLVLAGVDYLLPIYRKVSEYANIMKEGITGSPDRLRPEELHNQAWPVVEDYFRQDTEKTVERYQQLAGTDKAADNVEEIVAAAVNGRVDTLVLAVNAQVWGKFDPDTRRAVRNPVGQAQPDDLPLLDFAAVKTLENGGSVYALSREEMPTDSPAAALFRY